jgi:Skp family chaperone for outer membrane proteins
MATDDTTKTDDTTQDDPPAETATGKTGADPTTDKTTEALRAENERIKKALAETNRKALADRKRLEDIDREKQEREDEKLGEAERLKKQLKESEDAKRAAEQLAAKLEEQVIAGRIDQAIERAAKNLFIDPDLAPKVIDRTRITYDPDTDKISGIKEALEAVLKQFPTLGGAQRGGGSPAAMRTRQPGGGHTPAASEADRMAGIREEMARMVDYEPM